jgi:Family of unknown function (DUF6267)
MITRRDEMTLEVHKLKHLDHTEDLPIRHGKAGFDHAHKVLLATHDFLKGKHSDKFSISTKYDGSPSIVFGHHPTTGKFFVGSKSVFNKNAKINFSHEDIEKNHGHAPGLVTKLKDAFTHLQNNIPTKGVYQGDLMYSGDDVKKSGNHLKFQPNTLEYKVHKDTPEGHRIQNSKIGMVVHTGYKGKGIEDMKASFSPDLSKFNNKGDVNFIDPKVSSGVKYTPDQEKDFTSNLFKARQLHNEVHKSKVYDLAKDQEPLLLGYANHAVREGKPVSTSGYMAFINNRHKKVMDELKSDKVKGTKKLATDTLLKTIADNKPGYDKLFDLHKAMAAAKKPLVDALSSHSGFQTSAGGKATKPEGFVTTQNGIPSKLVDRDEFSKANFDWNEKANPEDNPMVFSFGRMNPPTMGHEVLVNRVQDIARRMGASHEIVMSHTQDSKKNPLSPDEKLDYAKSAFPSTNITIAGKDHATVIQQLKKLNGRGVRHLTMVVGDDRVQSFSKLLNDLNGKEFHFKKIKVVSAGARNPDDEGAQGMSASKMRKAAAEGDWETFKKGVPSQMADDKAHGMYKTLRNKMGVKDIKPDDTGHVMTGIETRGKPLPKSDVKIGKDTPNISLQRYSTRPRKDLTGRAARIEIAKRKQQGKWSGT